MYNPPIVTTNSTTRAGSYCEICHDWGDVYNKIDVEILHLEKNINYDHGWHCLCDKHKREYDVKYNIKLRKEKLEVLINIKD